MGDEKETSNIQIDRISANRLTYHEFIAKYQNNNKPVIITDIQIWNKKSNDIDKVGIDKLNDIIDDNHLFKGIFVSKYKDHRYLYFKNKSNEQIDDNKTEDMTYFKSMKWMNFYKELKKQSDINDDNLYLYGRPLPNELYNHLKLPSFLIKDKNETLKLYLWISNTFTCSKLHFDLNEGFLYQLNGSKKVTLISSTYDHKSLYPFQRSSKYWRQSQIDNVHEPNIKKFPLFYKNKIVKYEGIINKNEGLYIPFGWWHQIESIYKNKNDGGIISISTPWNPYKQEMNIYLTQFVNEMNSKFEECNDLEIASKYAQLIFDKSIAESKLLPYFIKNIASIWKSTVVVNCK